ncbi:MAG: septal ring lytic transglycosylase RlpA family protein [Pseudomonadota bacterium]
MRGAGVLVAIAAVLPLSASLASSSPDDASDPARQVATSSTSSAETTSFAAQFEPYAGPPRAVIRSAGAVDLDGFDPPIETPPPPPTSKTVRSLGTGIASYYGRRFHGRRTANGERFNMRAMTAAHRTLPFGTKVRVTNPSNGRTVTVRINDRGPFIRGRSIDLSRAAAEKIGMISRGHARVKMEVVR